MLLDSVPIDIDLWSVAPFQTWAKVVDPSFDGADCEMLAVVEPVDKSVKERAGGTDWYDVVQVCIEGGGVGVGHGGLARLGVGL